MEGKTLHINVCEIIEMSDVFSFAPGKIKINKKFYFIDFVNGLVKNIIGVTSFSRSPGMFFKSKVLTLTTPVHIGVVLV